MQNIGPQQLHKFWQSYSGKLLLYCRAHKTVPESVEKPSQAISSYLSIKLSKYSQSISLHEKMSFLAYLQSSAHRVFHSAMNIMTCTNCTAKMKGIHSALFEWQLKNRHQPNFGPKNIYRSDSSVTSVTDRSDRSDSSVIRRLQK